MLRLLLCDYQRTARYYTIYRTFKEWSSDDFATISRLFYWRNYDCWLRLFQKLLRLFQPGRYDYCSSLLAIGRKPEKRCGESRQWFRAARRAPATGLPRRACLVCDVLHCLAWIHNRGAPLHSYIPYYNRAAVLACTASGVAAVSVVYAGGVAAL